MAWLPHEHDGARTIDEARADLATIAAADPPLNEAHVVIDSQDGRQVLSGDLSADASESGTLEIRVNSQPTFSLNSDEFENAWLHTLDGADYYILNLQLRGGRTIRVSDAYNGR